MSAVHRSSVDNLIRMANDIAENLGHGVSDHEIVVERVVEHIVKFWSRSMRRELKEIVENNSSSASQVIQNVINIL